MIRKRNRVAVVLARKDSKRIKNKINCKLYNKSLCQYETLVERKIRQLSEVDCLDKIILGTDDKDLKLIAKHYNNCELILRQSNYCDDNSKTMNDIVKNILTYFESDVVLWANPTTPFIETKHYFDALHMFDLLDSNNDSVASVSKSNNHYFDSDGAINFNLYTDEWCNNEETIPLFGLNNGIFVRDYNDMKRDGNLLGKSPRLLETSMIESINITEQYEYEIAKLISEHDSILKHSK